VSEKPPYTEDKAYIPRRTDAPGESPRELRPGELGTSEATGTAHVMKADGRVATLPVAEGFVRIVTLSQTAYNALAEPDPMTLYIVTPDPE
jgi:hypothetical protein